MGITKFVLRRPVTTFLVILCLIVFGISSLFGSKLELIPNMEMPMMVVTAIYPGASPKDVNDLVTKPIEDKVETLSSVKQVTSYSNENMAFVLLQYEYGTNMDKAYTDLKKSLDSVKGSLPDDVDTPNIMEFNINDAATMTIAVNNDAQENLYNYVDNNIVPEIEKLSSVASVDVSGGRENYIKVEAIPEKLAQYKLSLQSLAQAVSGADFSYPAGKTTLGSQSLSVTTGETFDTLESLKNIPITLPSGSTIYLQDVAKIYSTYADASGIGRYDGKDTIALGIHMQESSSAGEVSRQLHKVIDERDHGTVQAFPVGHVLKPHRRNFHEIPYMGPVFFHSETLEGLRRDLCVRSGGFRRRRSVQKSFLQFLRILSDFRIRRIGGIPQNPVKHKALVKVRGEPFPAERPVHIEHGDAVSSPHEIG